MPPDTGSLMTVLLVRFNSSSVGTVMVCASKDVSEFNVGFSQQRTSASPGRFALGRGNCIMTIQLGIVIVHLLLEFPFLALLARRPNPTYSVSSSCSVMLEISVC